MHVVFLLRIVNCFFFFLFFLNLSFVYVNISAAPSSSGDDASLDLEETSLAESQPILKAASSRSRLDVFIDLLPLPLDAAAERPVEPSIETTQLNIASDAASDSTSTEPVDCQHIFVYYHQNNYLLSIDFELQNF